MDENIEIENGIKDFINQFGEPDIHTMIVLEHIFYKLLHDESIHLSSEDKREDS